MLAICAASAPGCVWLACCGLAGRGRQPSEASSRVHGEKQRPLEVLPHRSRPEMAEGPVHLHKKPTGRSRGSSWDSGG